MLNSFYNFYPNSILFSAFGINIYWYGLFVFLGVLLGFIVYVYLSKKAKIEDKFIYNSFFYTFTVGMIGARLFYVLYNYSYYLKNPMEILMIWNGGIAILGGILFGALFLFFYAIRNSIKNIFVLFTIVSISLCLGQSIGRVGNYFNQELFGVPTNFFIKIPVKENLRPAEFANEKFFTPLFFYESSLNFILFLCLFFWFKFYLKNNVQDGFAFKEIKVKEFRKRMKLLTFVEGGGIFLIYVNFYLILRFVLEFFRIGELKFYIFSINQYISVFLILMFNLVWFLRKKIIKK